MGSRSLPAVGLAPVVLGLTFRHHHLTGPSADYLGLAAAAAASWAGLPGPGEALLVAAGMLSARHRLDIGAVLVVAWAGATVGGIGGWLVGAKAGRAVVTAPGPLRAARLAALRRGEWIFHRFGPVAVFFAPSWVAGIHRMRLLPFAVSNAVSAVVWALAIGLGAYYAGPAIADAVSDRGLIGGAAAAAVIVAVLAIGGVRRRRRRPPPAPAREGSG